MNHNKNKNPIDWTTAMEEFEGDKDFVLHLLDSFVGKFSPWQKEIEELLGDREGGLRRQIHKLKGSAGNLYALSLYEMAKDWEEGILKNYEIDDKSEFQKILSEIERIKAFIDSIDRS